MDWKIPATILILIVLVSLGVLPFFSPNFSASLTDMYSSVKEFINKISNKETNFNGNIVLSLSTKELNELKIGFKTKLYLKLKGDYCLNVDNKNLSVKGDLFLNNFTGVINFKNFSISGTALEISAENFKLYGKSKIQANNKNFEKLTISNLKIAELTITKGKIKTTEPRKIEAEIDDLSKVYGFSGTLNYQNNTAVFEGNCTKIQMKEFTFG